MLAFHHVDDCLAPALNSARSLLIAGAGDLGSRLARLRAALGDDVIALRRREVELGDTVRCLRADLVAGEGFARLPRRVDALVFCAAPEQRTETSYRALYVDGLRRLLDSVQAHRLILVSSTAVYAEDAGEWVDEGTLARSEQFNARALLDAEQELAGHEGASVLRLTGLYGPGRESLLRRARNGDANRRRWSNRIHIEDAARALSHLLDITDTQRLFLGTDDAPALECEVQDWLRAREGLPEIVARDEAQSGRRVSNARLRASGWMPLRADYRAGFTRV